METVRLALKEMEGQKVAVVFHNDCDGICSGAQLVKYLGKKNHVAYFSTRGSPSISPDLMKDILDSGPDKVVTVDFAADLDAAAREFHTAGIEGIMLDHHPPPDYDFPEGILYYNPHLDDKQMPASALTYDLIDDLQDLWIAAVGTILDYGAQERPDLVEEAMEAYPDLFEVKDIDTPRLFKTSFGKIGHVLNASFLWGGHKGGEQALGAVLEVDGPREFLGGRGKAVRTLLDNFQTVEDDLQRLIREFGEHHHREGNLIWFKVESRYPQKSQLATVVSSEHPEKVVAILQDGDGRTKISLRNQAGLYDLNRIIKEASSGLDAHGGGHKKAAAASVSFQDVEKFLERLKSIMNANLFGA